MTKKIITFFALAFAITLPLLNVNASAQTPTTPQYKIVNTKAGLNLRDRNCKVISVLPYGTTLVNVSNSTINCTINNQTVKMVNYATIGDQNPTYVAEKYISNLISNYLDLSAVRKVEIDTQSGLNLRDEKCRRITTLKKGEILDVSQGIGGSIKICKVGNSFYNMIDVAYKGKAYLVADKFVKVSNESLN